MANVQMTVFGNVARDAEVLGEGDKLWGRVTIINNRWRGKDNETAAEPYNLVKFFRGQYAEEQADRFEDLYKKGTPVMAIVEPNTRKELVEKDGKEFNIDRFSFVIDRMGVDDFGGGASYTKPQRAARNAVDDHDPYEDEAPAKPAARRRSKSSGADEEAPAEKPARGRTRRPAKKEEPVNEYDDAGNDSF